MENGKQYTHELKLMYADLSNCNRQMKNRRMTKEEATNCIDDILRDMSILYEKMEKIDYNCNK